MNPDLPRIREVRLPRGSKLLAGVHAAPPMALLGCAAGALELLRGLLIAVIGCGSVGGRIALLLARLGIGGLCLVDPKNYKLASVATHDVDPDNVGDPKALVTARRCKAINPVSRVFACVGRVEDLDPGALAGVDLVVMAPDLLSAETAVAQRCLWLGKPLVHASLHGSTLTLQVRFFQNAKAAGPCPACSYGATEWDMLARQAVFSCEGSGGPAAHSTAAAPATNSISALCSLAADLAVLQLVRFILKIGRPEPADTMLQFTGFKLSAEVIPLRRNPNCRLDHTEFKPVKVDGPLENLTLADVSQRSIGAPPHPDTQFDIGGWDWIEFASCACGQPVPVQLFVPHGQSALSNCPKCSAPRVPLSFYTHRTVSASVLGPAINQPLRKLGARSVPSVLVRAGDSGAIATTNPSLPCL